MIHQGSFGSLRFAVVGGFARNQMLEQLVHTQHLLFLSENCLHLCVHLVLVSAPQDVYTYIC